MRHTFASLLLQQGESLVYVKEQMGHASIQITVDCYGHLIPGGNKQAVDPLDSPASEVGPSFTKGPQGDPEGHHTGGSRSEVYDLKKTMTMKMG